MTQPIYFLNGNYVPADQATVSLQDLGVIRGYGVFDFLRTYHGKPFHLIDHLQRLRFSAEQIDIPFPYKSIEQLADIVLETFGRNQLAEGSIRLVLTGGLSSSFFLPEGQPTFAIMVAPLKGYPPEYFSKGCRVITSRLQRELPTVKTLNYIGAILAMKRASKRGAVEALYVDSENRISEGTRANFFGVRDGVLISPSLDVLDGITRRVTLKLAAPHFAIEERPIPLGEVRELDEAFLTSSTKEIMPVVKVDDLTIGRGRVGPVTRRLMAMFRQYAYGG